MSTSVYSLKLNLHQGFTIYEKYKRLINSYVLDYFTEDHWSKLPESWKIMEGLSTSQLAELLDYDTKHSKTFMFPLSLLALKVLSQTINISRKQFVTPQSVRQDEKFKKLFWKNVKLKKRHEILIMAELCHKIAKQCQCFYIVDIGSGLGHLSRLLNYGYNFQVCAIEAQTKLIEQAGILDKQFSITITKKYGEKQATKHVNMRIEPSITPEEFLNVVRSSFGINDEVFQFGIVGLHPCGDLGSTLLRIYNKLPNIKFINIVGCCYMKLSTSEDSANPGFPLSKFCLDNNYQLCYHSREIACHAIENYISKLNEGEYWKLKIHAFRASIEKILVEINEQYKHIPLANVKYTENLDFESYCRKATAKLVGIVIESDRIKKRDIVDCLKNCNSVVIFYSLRLFFAPLIESLILYDKILYLQEKGSAVNVVPGFDNKISPRMHVLQARKL